MLKSREQIKIVMIFMCAAGMTMACSKKSIEIDALSQSQAVESVDSSVDSVTSEVVEESEEVVDKAKDEIDKAKDEVSESLKD